MAEDRLTALCEQNPKVVTGIDFIEVVNPHVQKKLRVYFVIDPDTLSNPMVATGAMPTPADRKLVSIEPATGVQTHSQVPVTRLTWRQVPTPAGLRTVLEVDVREPGDFSLYRLTIHDEPAHRVDRFFNGVVFSFKQGCPSVFDCRRKRECPLDEDVDFPVDYLARDFESLRNALLDYSAQRYPLWRERIPADQAVMLMELAAALGDEFAYIQDRIAAEGSLDTLTERRSLRWHTRLVDYTLDDGCSATTWLDLQIRPGADRVIVPGSRVWATPAGEPAVPFEIGNGLEDQRPTSTQADADERARRFCMSPAWNILHAHVPDPAHACLFEGSIELYVRGGYPFGATTAAAVDKKFWKDRPVVIQTDPKDASIPARRAVVRLIDLEVTIDPLVPDPANAGAPLVITRLAWRSEDALPFDICLDDTTVHANILPASAGATSIEFFAIGSNDRVPPATQPDVSVALERLGPLNDLDQSRSTTFIHSLSHTETDGIGRLAPAASHRLKVLGIKLLEPAEIGRLRWVPEVELQEVLPNLGPLVPPRYWEWRASLIEARSDDPYYTLDDGTWRSVIGFDRRSGRIVHRDRASGAGVSIRFGDGEFGRLPSDRTVFQVKYRTGLGASANVPADSIRTIVEPFPPANPPALTLTGIADTVTNPLPVTDGRDPQSMDLAKAMAPEAYKARPRRAVRDEDYREIAECLPWVQRAGATARWTGSWLTEFVTADPRDIATLPLDLRGDLTREMECVRQAGRPVVVRDPVYLPVDLRIVICVEPSAYEGQVIERVLAALTGRRRIGQPLPFFDPNQFTFGTALNRAALEAQIQSVPGVHGVEEIRLRARGLFDWRLFSEFIFAVGDDRILRLDNNPNHPEFGALTVTTKDLVA